MTVAFWLLGAVVAAGITLGCFYLQERRIRGPWAWLSGAHGVAGTVGVALVLFGLWRHGGSAWGDGAWGDGGRGDGAQGFDNVAGGMLAATLAGGALVVWAQLRGRRPSGLVVALHATLGVAGYVMLAAALSLRH